MAKEQQEKNRLASFANIVSLALNPIFMIILMTIGVSIKYQIPILMFVLILLPFFALTLAYIIFKIFIKRDSDFDMTKLRMRKHIGYTATVGFALSFLLAHNYFPFLDGMFLRAGIVVLITGLVTLKWKISFHAVGYASFCFTYVVLFGPVWFATTALLPIVFWARLKLKRHTFAQLIAGTLLSLIILI